MTFCLCLTAYFHIYPLEEPLSHNQLTIQNTSVVTMLLTFPDSRTKFTLCNTKLWLAANSNGWETWPLCPPWFFQYGAKVQSYQWTIWDCDRNQEYRLYCVTMKSAWCVWAGPDSEFHRVLSRGLWKHFVEICCPTVFMTLLRKQLLSSV